MLKLVPNELREASYALGVPKWKTIVQDRPADRVLGILTGCAAGPGPHHGRDGPLLILVGYSQSINTDLFGGTWRRCH